MARGKDRFLEEMAALDVDFDADRVRSFPAGTRTAEDAAEAIGCTTRAIVKSLVFMADDEPVLALVNGASRADERLLRGATGSATLRRATADEVRAHTGYAIGGTPPIARVGEIRRWMDRSLLDLAQVWAAAGTPRDVFPIDPHRLAEVTGATVADLVTT